MNNPIQKYGINNRLNLVIKSLSNEIYFSALYIIPDKNAKAGI